MKNIIVSLLKHFFIFLLFLFLIDPFCKKNCYAIERKSKEKNRKKGYEEMLNMRTQKKEKQK